jgi:hypothetical protein
LALKRFIQAFGGVTGHALFSLKAVGPGVKWPVSLVADVHHVRSKQRFVALHLTRDASSIVAIPCSLEAAFLGQHPCCAGA